ncbi:MAG TPA: cohesin domain-containing protein [Candidatus Woesebacteria bacterium]|nr:cohesin domain-containing protein [Candidatus Woesebacteria bacterium]
MKRTVQNLLILSAFLLLSTKVAAAADPRFSLNPATGNYKVNDTFTVTIAIDSAGQVVGAADAVGTFDSNILELTSLNAATDMVFNSTQTGGSCMPSSSSEWASGKFSITCYSNMSSGDEAVSGNLAVLTFKAKTTGTANVNFTCNGGAGDSNIIQSATVKDLIVCSANGSGSYTISAGSSTSTVTSTPTPTIKASTTTTTTTTTTELPQTGGIATTLGLIVFGAISLASALFLKFL